MRLRLTDLFRRDPTATAPCADLPTASRRRWLGDESRRTPGLAKSAVRRFVDGLLVEGVSRGASEIRIEPVGDGISVRVRVEGRFTRPCTAHTECSVSGIAGILEEYAHLYPPDGSTARVGRFSLKAETRDGNVREARLLVEVNASESGERVTIRIFPDLDLARAIRIARVVGESPPGPMSLRNALVPRPPPSSRVSRGWWLP
jgi:type II secretory ATPase GspE/PulE/Tfp pilus assembly ATPase PilB-like protein